MKPRRLFSALAACAALLGTAALPDGVSQGVVAGQAVFEGKGHCNVCHFLESGGEGRGPDLGGIGRFAKERARQFGLKGEDPAALYLVRSILHPADDVVEDFNPMPESWLPSGLTDEEIRDLVLYLQSLGGHPDPAKVVVPADWTAAKREEYARERALFSLGDPAKGKELFYDRKSHAGCARCHAMDGEGENICPDLTTVSRVQSPLYVLHSILDPSAFIAGTYRQLLILDTDGVVHTGLPKSEDDESIVLTIDQDGNTEEVYKDEIDQQAFSEVSLMPAGFGDQMTGQELMDVVAFVLNHESLAKKEAAAAEKKKTDAVKAATVAPPSLVVFPPATGAQTKYRTAMEKGDPVIGRRIYRHYCTMCHGFDGTGTGFNAVNLETKPANHTLDRRMAKTDDLLLHGVVTRGGQKTGRSFLMPPWGGTFSQREIWDLIAYLRTLHTDLEVRRE
ncbi:MAG: c-type cytochrome [Planctomycetota bacterium]